MKTTLLIKRFLQNWPVKVICLVLALFIYAFYQMSTLDSKTISLPLSVISNGSMVHSNTITHYVRVSIRGKTEDLVQISESDFTTYLDLNYYTESGAHNIPVSVLLSENAVKMSPLEYSCDPETIEVFLEPRITTYVSASPLFTGSLVDGYQLESIVCDPQFIEISGPVSIVEKVDSIQTKEISLEEKNSTFIKTVELINKNSFISIDSDLSVTVTVSVAPIIISKSFSASVGLFSGIPTGYEVVSSFPTYSLELSGEKNDLEGFVLTPYSTQIDCSTITAAGDYELPLNLFLPSDFVIVSAQPLKALVSIEKISENEAGENIKKGDSKE